MFSSQKRRINSFFVWCLYISLYSNELDHGVAGGDEFLDLLASSWLLLLFPFDLLLREGIKMGDDKRFSLEPLLLRVKPLGCFSDLEDTIGHLLVDEDAPLETFSVLVLLSEVDLPDRLRWVDAGWEKVLRRLGFHKDPSSGAELDSDWQQQAVSSSS